MLKYSYTSIEGWRTIPKGQWKRKLRFSFIGEYWDLARETLDKKYSFKHAITVW